MEKTNKKVSVGLGTGIVFIPLIFSWFTLRKDYSRRAKVISLGWLAVSILIAMIALVANKPVAGENTASATTQPIHAEPHHKNEPVTEKVEPQKWYEGGGLQNKTASDWQKASYHQKLATAADIYAYLYKNHKLVSSIASKIHGIDDLRPYAESLVTGLDQAFAEKENQQIPAHQIVADTCVMLLLIQGYLK